MKILTEQVVRMDLLDTVGKKMKVEKEVTLGKKFEKEVWKGGYVRRDIYV